MRGRGGMRGWWGACVVVGGGVRRIGRDTVNERAVRILLECILVCYINAPKTIKRYRLPSFIWNNILKINDYFNFFLQGPPPPYSQPVWRHSSVHHAAQAAGSSSQLMMHNVPPNVPTAPTQSLSVIPVTIPTDLTQSMLVDPVLSSEGGVSMGPGVQNTFNAGQAFQPPLHSVLLEV